MIKVTFGSMWKQLLALMFVCVMSCQHSLAEDEGFFWYHNRVSAYPTGKGLVYATHEYGENPSEDQYEDGVTVKFYSHSSDEGIYVFNRAAEGYGFNGWYTCFNGKPSNFITRLGNIGGFLNPGSLDYSYSETDDEEYYDLEPNNEVLGVFGRVNYQFVIDNAEEVIRNDDMEEFYLSYAENHLSPGIDNPANELGDMVSLYTGKEYVIKDSVQLGDSIEIEETRIIFKGWTDTKGNLYSDTVLTFMVSEPETYTAHYEYMLSRVSNSIVCPSSEQRKVQWYLLDGRKLTGLPRRHGIHIVNGRKLQIK